MKRAVDYEADCQTGPSDAAMNKRQKLSPIRLPENDRADASVRDDAYYQAVYQKEPDFELLAKHDANFARCLKTNRQLDFSDAASVMQLTKTLLRHDFGIEIELPDDRLCPPVPVRHNYILWLKSLLDSSSYRPPGDKLLGIDIGTGSSCIYPILGCTERPWDFVATDIDDKNLIYAHHNISHNNLQTRIELVQRSPTDSLIPLDDLKRDRADFTMCNPPFYTSEDDLVASANAKSRPPNSACTGASVEMICPGGEDAFVDRIFRESLVLRERVSWYTTMFGKVSSVEKLVDKLRSNDVDNFAVNEFVQGTRTRRWAVGWSYGAMRPEMDAARGVKGLAAWKKWLPAVGEVDVLTVPASNQVQVLVNGLITEMESLDLLSWSWDAQEMQGLGRAAQNVWSRQWRRRKLHEGQGAGKMQGVEGSVGAYAFGFAIAIRAGASECVVSCRWREGHDAVTYESFCGFLRKRLKSVLGVSI